MRECKVGARHAPPTRTSDAHLRSMRKCKVGASVRHARFLLSRPADRRGVWSVRFFRPSRKSYVREAFLTIMDEQSQKNGHNSWAVGLFILAMIVVLLAAAWYGYNLYFDRLVLTITPSEILTLESGRSSTLTLRNDGGQIIIYKLHGLPPTLRSTKTYGTLESMASVGIGISYNRETPLPESSHITVYYSKLPTNGMGDKPTFDAIERSPELRKQIAIERVKVRMMPTESRQAVQGSSG